MARAVRALRSPPWHRPPRKARHLVRRTDAQLRRRRSVRHRHRRTRNEASRARPCGGDLLLLDLRGRAAMRAGTVAAISAGDHRMSQPWSRYFWERPEIYGELDGLLYPSAHNGEPAVALYERGRVGIEVPPGRDAPLTNPAVRAALRRVALDHRLVVLPLP